MRAVAIFSAFLAGLAAIAAETTPHCSIQLDAADTHRLHVSCPKSDRVRFIGLGDWGETFEAPYVLAVRDGVLKEAKKGNYDFILTVGDNIYSDGVNSTTDPLWDSIWRQRWHVGTDLKLPWLAVLGNHDHHQDADAQIRFHQSGHLGAEYWYLPNQHYSIDAVVEGGKKLKITTVDTVTLDATSLAWAAKELNDTSAEMILAAGHYHVYSLDERGDTTKPTMLQLNQLIQTTPKVKAYLCGHEHSMQYHTASNKDYFVFGGSGRTIDPQEVFPTTKAKTEFFSRNYGFATFDVEVAKRRMTVTYHVFNANGAAISKTVFSRKY